MQPRIFNIHSEKKHHISRLMAPINGLKREIQNTQLLVNTVLSFADEPIQEDILEQPIATQYQKSQKGLLECQNSMMSSLAILEEVLALHSCQNIMDDIQSSINYLSSKFDKKLIKIFVNSDYYKRIKDLTHLNNLEINNIVDRINQLCINLQEKEQDKFSFRSSYKELLSLLNKLHKMFGQSQENELEQSTISTVHLLMNELSQLPVDKNYKVPNNIKKVCDQLIGCINQLEKLVNFLTPITTDKLEEKTHEASEHSEQIKQPVLASEEKEEKENVEPSSEILLSTTITKPVDCWVKNDKGNEVLALTRTYQEMLCVVDQLVDQQRLTSDQEKIQSLKEQEIILKKLIELDTSQCSPDDLKYLHKKR